MSVITGFCRGMIFQTATCSSKFSMIFPVEMKYFTIALYTSLFPVLLAKGVM
jgi:hypothetical protein